MNENNTSGSTLGDARSNIFQCHRTMGSPIERENEGDQPNEKQTYIPNVTDDSEDNHTCGDAERQDENDNRGAFSNVARSYNRQFASGEIPPHFYPALPQENMPSDTTIELDNDNLPIAVPVEDVQVMPDEEDNTSVVHGEIIDQEEYHQKFSKWKVWLSVVIVILISIGIVLAVTLSRESETSTGPRYSQVLKEVFIPISGEDVLDDPSSHQNFLWEQLSAFEEFYLNQPTFWNEIYIQTYVVGLIQLSLIGDSAKSQIREMTHGVNEDQEYSWGDECYVYRCDPNFRVTGLIMKNIKPAGSIPYEIGALKKLRFLILPDNGIMGSIPSELGMLKDLHTLDLHNNDFTGSIPTELSQIDSLRILDLSNNKLTNTIPTEIGNFPTLFYFDFSQNRLTGSIPSEVLKLSDLAGLDLHRNNLTGKTDFLCEMNFTNTFWSFNFSTGSILHPIYKISAHLGATVDCVEDSFTFGCTCCMCVSV